MQYNWGNCVDVSSFVLVEATGDSEAPSASDSGAPAEAGDSDAESCVCDPCHSGDAGRRVGTGWRGVRRHDSAGGFRGFDDDDDGDGEGEVCSSIVDRLKKKRRRGRNSEKVVISSCKPAAAAPEKCRKGNGAREDSSKSEMMRKETESNKLFWETCLAS